MAHNNIRAVPGKFWGDMQRLEGQGTSEAPLPGTLKCVSHPGVAHTFQSYRDESGTPEMKKPTGKHQGNTSEE